LTGEINNLNKEKPIKTEYGVKHADFCFKNKIIEFNGDNVHSNPEFYRQGEFQKYLFKPKNMLVEDVWAQDYKRINSLIKEGYEILIIWSKDYFRNKESTVEKCLQFLTC
jgi:hypothetical protein